MKIRISQVTLLACVCSLIMACSKKNEVRDPDRVGVNEAPVNERTDDEIASDERTRSQRAGSELGYTQTQGQSAATSIAQSRCAREERCNNVGADKKYSSFAVCESKIASDWREDLSARECKAGVDQRELDECLADIRNEDCGSPFDSLARMASCTQAEICAD